MNAPDWRYRLLMPLLAPLLAVYGVWQGIRARDARLAMQRMGFAIPRFTDRPVLLHMASVGEVNAARPLIVALRQTCPDIPIVISTFTPTGAATVRRVLPDIPHVYLPLDLRWATARFLDRVRPRCALVLETEIWPRLFSQCRRRGIPVVIVNGRLSPRTMTRPAWMRAVLDRALRDVTEVQARSDVDAANYLALGAPPDRVHVLGNLKFSAPLPSAGVPPIAPGRPYVLAASTHHDEELQIVRAWREHRPADDCLLVIAPRHPDRAPAILGQLRALGANVVMRSRNEPVMPDTEVYLADTFGELPGFIADAVLVFVGGSLIPRGGQNVIEVARAGKVALFGPHMTNFEDESRQLLAHDAAVQVTSARELIAAIDALLADPARRAVIGSRAAQVVAAQAGIAQRYVDAVARYLGTAS